MQASKYLLLSIFILFCTQIMIKLRLQSCSGRFRGLDTPLFVITAYQIPGITQAEVSLAT